MSDDGGGLRHLNPHTRTRVVSTGGGGIGVASGLGVDNQPRFGRIAAEEGGVNSLVP